MRSLRSVCGVSLNDRCRKSDVRERCGLKEDVVTVVERGLAGVALENPMQIVLVAYGKGPNFEHQKPTSLHEKIGCQAGVDRLPRPAFVPPTPYVHGFSIVAGPCQSAQVSSHTAFCVVYLDCSDRTV
ncbi:hypothetical protein EVAR_4219_1 [Eumeta japonica]|uniref:Uncharacterized protein n=1 Tax=Eumeta variegata TaxID=151549 RepID=A0A4C1TJ90_EUMVA|nr:hypothetical protein EVAR_4219_1 [Eumeta japonica]